MALWWPGTAPELSSSLSCLQLSKGSHVDINWISVGYGIQEHKVKFRKFGSLDPLKTNGWIPEMMGLGKGNFLSKNGNF